MGIELLLPINLTKNVSKEKEKTLILVIWPLKWLRLLFKILEKYGMPELKEIAYEMCKNRWHFNKK